MDTVSITGSSGCSRVPEGNSIFARTSWLGGACLVLLAATLLYGCSRPTSSGASSGRSTLPITLPDGTEIRAELALTPSEHARGLMFRKELALEHGMLFVFPDMQRRPFWMFQTLIALDIIWLDEQQRIVEISPNTPPCQDRNSRGCPNHGGAYDSKYVLELAAGQASVHRLRVGDRLRF